MFPLVFNKKEKRKYKETREQQKSNREKFDFYFYI